MGGIGNVYPKSGFKTVSPIQFLNGLCAVDRKLISYRAFRVYVAAFAVMAVREAAARSRKPKRDRGRPRTPKLKIGELAELARASEREVRYDLKSLHAHHLLAFSETG